MGFFKGVVVGAVAYAAVQYLTKRDILTGRSKFDELVENAPAYIDNVKDKFRQAEQEFVEPEVRI